MGTYTDKAWSETKKDLRETFKKWGIREWDVDADISPARAANARQSQSERGVTLSYVKDGVDIELRIDKWPRAVDNLRALYLTVESLRLNEYRGIADVVRQAYAQLPPPAPESVKRDPYDVLRVGRNQDIKAIENIYKLRARQLHPDTGGPTAAMAELNQAMDAIRKERAQV